MGERTGISWTDHTLNFWEGCTKVSPGCDNCYAAARNHRFSAGVNWGAGAPRRERLLRACEEARQLNRKAKEAGERRRVFVNSLSDFFDNEVPDDWRAYALGVMRACDWLDFQVLTKRIGNVADMIGPWSFWPLPNVWLGITCVNQEEYDRDWPKLEKSPAVVRWVSMEPLLGPITTRDTRPDWIVVGGESGRGARPMDPDWVRSLRDECAAKSIPFHFKQWGEWAPYDRGQIDSAMLVSPGSTDRPMQRFGKKVAGFLLDGVDHRAFPTQ